MSHTTTPINSYYERLKHQFYQDYTTTTLKALIIVVAIILIGAALFIDNKWLLAGILVWEILP